MLALIVLMFLAGIILLGAKSPLQKRTREQFLAELTKFLEGTVELIDDDHEGGKSYRISFKFKGEEYIYEDLESLGFKEKIYKGYVRIKTPSKLTLTFAEKERSTRIRSDIVIASEIEAHFIDKNTILNVPELLKDMQVFTNDTPEANRVLEDKKIISILKKYKNVDSRGYRFLSLGIIDGVVTLEFRPEKFNKPNLPALRENVSSIDDYLEQLIVIARKLKEKS
jgi:hypothetical protein